MDNKQVDEEDARQWRLYQSLNKPEKKVCPQCGWIKRTNLLLCWRDKDYKDVNKELGMCTDSRGERVRLIPYG